MLTLDEFRRILQASDAPTDLRSTLRAFREALMLTPPDAAGGADNISPEAFAAVAGSHGLRVPVVAALRLLRQTMTLVVRRAEDASGKLPLHATQVYDDLVNLLASAEDDAELETHFMRGVDLFRALVAGIKLGVTP